MGGQGALPVPPVSPVPRSLRPRGAANRAQARGVGVSAAPPRGVLRLRPQYWPVVVPVGLGSLGVSLLSRLVTGVKADVVTEAMALTPITSHDIQRSEREPEGS